VPVVSVGGFGGRTPSLVSYKILMIWLNKGLIFKKKSYQDLNQSLSVVKFIAFIDFRSFLRAFLFLEFIYLKL